MHYAMRSPRRRGIEPASRSALLFAVVHAYAASLPSYLSQRYVECLLFLQLSHSSALLIFSARTDGPACAR